LSNSGGTLWGDENGSHRTSRAANLMSRRMQRGDSLYSRALERQVGAAHIEELPCSRLGKRPQQGDVDRSRKVGDGGLGERGRICRRDPAADACDFR